MDGLQQQGDIPQDDTATLNKDLLEEGIVPSEHSGFLDVFYTIQNQHFCDALESVREALARVVESVEKCSAAEVKVFNIQYQMALKALWCFFRDDEKDQLVQSFGELGFSKMQEFMHRYFYSHSTLKTQDVFPRRELLRLLVDDHLPVPEGLSRDASRRLEPLLTEADKMTLMREFRQLPRKQQHRLVALYFHSREKIESWELLKLVCDGHLSVPGGLKEDRERYKRLGFPDVE